MALSLRKQIERAQTRRERRTINRKSATRTVSAKKWIVTLILGEEEAVRVVETTGKSHLSKLTTALAEQFGVVQIAAVELATA